MESCDNSSLGYSTAQQFLDDNDFDSVFQHFNQHYMEEERNFSCHGNMEEAKLYLENNQKKRKIEELDSSDITDVRELGGSIVSESEASSASSPVHKMMISDSKTVSSDGSVDVKEFDRKLFFMKLSHPRHRPLEEESRLSYLCRVPHLLQAMGNRFDLVRFEEIVKEAFTENCELRSLHSKAAFGRHLITERLASVMRSMPDWICMRSPCKVEGRVISVRELAIGTFMPSKSTGKEHWSNVLKKPSNESASDPNSIYAIQKFQEAARDNKPLKFECAFQNLFILNEAMTHIEKNISESPVMRFF